MSQNTLFLPRLSAIQSKILNATFDGGRMSSNGGVIVLRKIVLRLGVADVITKPLPDNREPMRVTHGYADMALARILPPSSLRSMRCWRRKITSMRSV